MKIFKLNRVVLGATILLFTLNTVTSQVVTPWFTTGDQSKLLQPQTTVSFGPNISPASVIVTLDPSTVYQTMDGFGYTLTEGSAEVISSLSSYQQSLLLNELFNRSTGLGISVLRISIGASDLSSSDYSYNEVSGDVAMTNFSLAGPDLSYLIPILKKALAINPDIKILATPWSAPRWMKSNNNWIGGSLKTNYYTAYANYFVKYFDAMKAQGINIWAITPQNEPENGGNDPSMVMSSTEQKNFINNNLGPAMNASGYIAIKIIAYDHNCDNTAYPIDVLNNSSYVDGAAFHLYGGDISALTTVKNATGKNVYFTEQYTGSTGNFSGDLGWHTQNVLIGSANNWAKAILEWNLASNTSIGPHTPSGCSTCLGAITINNSISYTRNLSYYLIGQVSKFVTSGAVRIKSTSSSSNFYTTAFQNPDRSIAVLTYNSSNSSQIMKMTWNSQTFVFTVPGSSVATFVWNPAASAVTEVSTPKFSLSPNPGNTVVTIKLPVNDAKYTSVSFISLDGKIVLNQYVSSENVENSIDVSLLTSGIYMVKLNGLNGQLYGRFIKQ